MKKPWCGDTSENKIKLTLGTCVEAECGVWRIDDSAVAALEMPLLAGSTSLGLTAGQRRIRH